MGMNDMNLHNQLKPRFDEALRDEVDQVDIQRFRNAFESAWTQRKWHERLLSKTAVSATLLLLTGAMFVYGLVSSDTRTAQPNQPVLMQGQRIVERPELLALFPEVEHPTVISSRSNVQVSENSYLIHGFMADESIQVVWEY